MQSIHPFGLESHYWGHSFITFTLLLSSALVANGGVIVRDGGQSPSQSVTTTITPTKTMPTTTSSLTSTTPTTTSMTTTTTLTVSTTTSMTATTISTVSTTSTTTPHTSTVPTTSPTSTTSSTTVKTSTSTTSTSTVVTTPSTTSHTSTTPTQSVITTCPSSCPPKTTPTSSTTPCSTSSISSLTTSTVATTTRMTTSSSTPCTTTSPSSTMSQPPRSSQVSCDGVQPWQQNLAYNAGDKVIFNGWLFTAKQWSFNSQPGSSDAWTDNGECVQPINNKVDCAGVAAWQTTEAYPASSKVVFNNHLWIAVQWTSSNTPGDTSGTWKDLGACA